MYVYFSFCYAIINFICLNLFKPNEFGKFHAKQFGNFYQIFQIWL